MLAFKSVSEYIRAQPPSFRAVLQKVRTQIKAAAPKAEEGISYGMPAYHYKGPLVYFGAFKNHCSFFPGSTSVLTNQEGLKGFTVSKGTIRFTPDNPLPAALIKSMVKERVRENETRARLNQQGKKTIRKTAKKKTIKK